MLILKNYKDIFNDEIVKKSKGIIYSYDLVNEKYNYQPFSHDITEDAIEKLGLLMRHNLLFYSFGEDEVEEAYEKDMFVSLEQAAKYVYNNRLPRRDPKQDGLPSEVLLDLLIQIYNPDAYKLAVRTIFRQNDNNEIKGYDLTYFTKDESGISLWLGQAKLGEKNYCKNGINNDLITKYTMDYLAKQLYFVSDKRKVISDDVKSILELIQKLNIRSQDDNDENRSKLLIDLLNKNGVKVIIPCLLAYDEASVYRESILLDKCIKSEIDKMKHYFNNKMYSFVNFSPQIIFYVFPIKNVDDLRDKDKGFYAGLC